jgi:hypothetical protein
MKISAINRGNLFAKFFTLSTSNIMRPFTTFSFAFFFFKKMRRNNVPTNYRINKSSQLLEAAGLIICGASQVKNRIK